MMLAVRLWLLLYFSVILTIVCCCFFFFWVVISSSGVPCFFEHDIAISQRRDSDDIAAPAHWQTVWFVFVGVSPSVLLAQQSRYLSTYLMLCEWDLNNCTNNCTVLCWQCAPAGPPRRVSRCGVVSLKILHHQCVKLCARFTVANWCENLAGRERSYEHTDTHTSTHIHAKDVKLQRYFCTSTNVSVLVWVRRCDRVWMAGIKSKWNPLALAICRCVVSCRLFC